MCGAFAVSHDYGVCVRACVRVCVCVRVHAHPLVCMHMSVYILLYLCAYFMKLCIYTFTG